MLPIVAVLVIPSMLLVASPLLWLELLIFVVDISVCLCLFVYVAIRKALFVITEHLDNVQGFGL